MKIALYIAFQNKSSIDCCKEIIDLISKNNQLIIDSKVKNDLDESKKDNFIFLILMSKSIMILTLFLL